MLMKEYLSQHLGEQDIWLKKTAVQSQKTKQ